jgi:hypothetical protein
MMSLASATAAAVLLGGMLLAPAGGMAAENPPPAPAQAAAEPAARLTVTSDSECPSGAAITAELEAISPLDQGPSGTVHVHMSGEMLIVELVSGTTTQRQLPVTGDCGTRATTVALVIATWTGELSSAAAGEPTLRPTSGTLAGSPAASSPPAVVPAFVHERELGTGLLLSLSGRLAPGLEIDYVQTRAPRGWGWQAGLAVPVRRESSGPGLSTSWTRAAVNLAINRRSTWRRVALSASAGLVGAYTFISARGYSFERSARALTVGAMAEVRAAIPWWRLRVWTALRGGRWLVPQSVDIETQGGDRVATIDLPSWDLQWALGLSYLFR